MVAGNLLVKDEGHVYLLAWVPRYGWLFFFGLFCLMLKKNMHKRVNVIGLDATTVS